MANLSLSPPPGYYLDPPALTWVYSTDVDRVAFTMDGTQPTVSEYIAYDTLTPPNPFIAVTQDGRGNVVYDGGFPKFYNRGAPAVGASFSQMSASFKYLYNAINYVANKTKVVAGNKKLLVIGDAAVSQNYAVKSTASTGFYTSFTRIAAIAGYQATIKDISDWDGTINPSLVELEQYALVILMSSVHSESAHLITNAAVTNMVTYRENGNGLIFITDHGPFFDNIDDAKQTGVGFFGVANRVIVNFGAYFSGDYDRSPVNVGHLRANYGDHPLYNGMSDSESIWAGGSESRVFVATYETYPPASLPTFSTNDEGITTISALAVLKDGSTETFRFVYTTVGGDVFELTDLNGVTVTETTPTFSPSLDFNIRPIETELGTLRGVITKNSKVVGGVEIIGAQVDMRWYAGGNDTVFVNDGDIVAVEITTPFQYKKEIIARRIDAPIKAVLSLSRSIRLLKDRGLITKSKLAELGQLEETLSAAVPSVHPTSGHRIAERLGQIRKFFANALDLPPTVSYTFATEVEKNQHLASVPKTLVCVVVQSGAVYHYINEAWTLIPNLKAVDIFSAPRVVTNPLTGKSYRLSNDGSIVTS